MAARGDSRMLALWYAVMMGACALVCGISLALDLTPDAHRWIELSFIAGLLPFAVGIGFFGHRLPRAFYEWVAVPGVTAQLALGIWLSQDPANPGGMVFIAALFYSFYFFEKRIAYIQLVQSMAGYMGALLMVESVAAAVDRWMFTFVIGGIIGFVASKLRERLERHAATDWLTRALNRRGFEARLAADLARGPVALMLVDADSFKGLNDRRGHAAGDEALRLIASVLQEAVGRERVGRIGGDEFAVLLRPDEEAAATVGAEVRAQLTAAGSPVTVSIGVAVGDGDADSLFRSADAALYGAKRAGRDRVELAAAS
jgi:diguanylate cyclase (GGDEF)-like protein